MDSVVERLAIEEFMRIVKFPEEDKFEKLARAAGADPEQVKKEAKKLGLLLLPATVDAAIFSLVAALRAIGKPVSVTHHPVGIREWNWGPHIREIRDVLQLITNHKISLTSGTPPDYDGYVGYSPQVNVGAKLPGIPAHDDFMKRVIDAKRAELDALVASKSEAAAATAVATEAADAGTDSPSETPSKKARAE